ncbi:uncharacterized protein LOC131612447 isoform X2 [Vicia villosa]|uniref:uncharacterized protein LOC131612447 isoform X2 n=1 Tax=Vicia villosa TaxID=3911 RepID=UPI00273B9CA1|nr:uncharacterized protein LOC131612447 isoform X2 [Vicia villosa]
MHLLGEKREILQSTVDLVQNNLNLEVIYGDTDSIMIYSGLDDIAKATSIAKKVIQEALVNVCGAVVCKEECGPFVSVTLVRQGAKHNEVRKTISLTSESSELLFSDVIPGKYRLEVKHSSPESVAKEDNWCWEKSFIDVNIGAEDLEGIVFVQKGYWVNVISTDGSTVNLKIQIHPHASKQVLDELSENLQIPIVVQPPQMQSCRLETKKIVMKIWKKLMIMKM